MPLIQCAMLPKYQGFKRDWRRALLAPVPNRLIKVYTVYAFLEHYTNANCTKSPNPKRYALLQLIAVRNCRCITIGSHQFITGVCLSGDCGYNTMGKLPTEGGCRPQEKGLSVCNSINQWYLADLNLESFSPLDPPSHYVILDPTKWLH